MKILVSNDDGYFAPGIRVLAAALEALGSVTVVAPDRNRSGASNSLTLDNPIRAYKTENGFYSVTGTPTDCIHLGTHELMSELPDIVVSGINQGANLGDDVLYSGTVAAAMEGRALGMPSIAVSLLGNDCQHYETAAAIIVKLIQRLQTHPLPPYEILNVNVPDLALNDLKGVLVTRCGMRHRTNTIIPAKDQKHRPIYWLGPPAQGDDAGEGTDFYAVENGYVSITPLHVDLTAHKSIQAVRNWTEGFIL